MFRKKLFKRKSGLTVIELLVVLFIIGLAFAFVSPSFISYRNTFIFDANVQNVVTVFEEARELTLASKDSKQYGVHIESDKVTLFTGATFDSMDPKNKVTSIDSYMTISIIDLNGGGADVVFSRLTGETDNYGTTTMQIVGIVSSQKDIVINRTGLITSQ